MKKFEELTKMSIEELAELEDDLWNYRKKVKKVLSFKRLEESEIKSKEHLSSITANGDGDE